MTYDKSHDVVSQITNMFHEKINNKFGSIFDSNNSLIIQKEESDK